ncbi:hypothetical protein CgunFtcFv8_000720 [Champsocephalus gunnari]|uniref:Deoxynucleoside triphosphate triphosphohydrolase SAMHD1 n=1 Tax=Champsocephalus gunnari TaxID=52237 RepID=A0AAN8HQE2_CHAGU|nr:hypothetical protein CgunFtcFv8_000720 [Champsocephalus gunnari]
MENWKHEEASVEMFDHLVESNGDLKGMMEACGMELPEDLDFIKEMIKPPKTQEESSPQYKERLKKKSFLYEIVANKRNGIDVDKFDYFSRDCHHLGIKNNFDHGRFIKFARVCEVDGQNHICIRDKEVNNLYDLFHTRFSLHRRAYQHNVVKIIEHMIAEAFLKADTHIQIEGSGRRKFTLSTAIDDMEAYTKLTEDYGEISGEDMFEYLKEKGLEMWADKFKEKSVIKLWELNDDVLAKMGIDQAEDRQKILDIILPAAHKHEEASVEMFDHLVESNGDLKGMMEACGMELPEDLDFIKEMIKPPKTQEESSPQYKERLKKKSFLYEIVANKRNGIDVDKFDYFARDCHHLGIKNNFDHDRFIKFARVCEVDGQKHICIRDKEVNNLYDLFHTRFSLHRRAYQHRVVKIIEHMITEAFLKADTHIQIEGSGRRKFTLSTAIDDMEAYTKLTDCVFDQILNSTEDNLKEAREILKNIVDRKHYRYLDEIRHKGTPTKEEIPQLKEELAAALPFPRQEAQADGLTQEDFVILSATMDYGSGAEDPINSVDFYDKKNQNQTFKIKREKVSKLLPVHFSETLFRVYGKTIDPKILEAAKRHFEQLNPVWSDSHVKVS